MTTSTVLIGARIEWWTRFGCEDGPGELRGSAWIEDAFHAFAVPAVGDVLSPQGLIDQDCSSMLIAKQPGPFMLVHRVEHYWAPRAGGGRELEDADRERTPGVVVVVRALAIDHASSLQRVEASLVRRGWYVDMTLGKRG